MATQIEIDCAIMAGISYISSRPEINRFPVPTGWTKITTPKSSPLMIFIISQPSYRPISISRGCMRCRHLRPKLMSM